MCSALSRLLRAGRETVSTELVLWSLCLRHGFSSKNVLELPLFPSRLWHEVSSNKVQPLVSHSGNSFLEVGIFEKREKILFFLFLLLQWWHWDLNISLECCISVIFFLWLVGVFRLTGEFWFRGERTNKKVSDCDSQPSCASVSQWRTERKGQLFHSKGYSACLSGTHSLSQPFLIKLSAGHLNLQLVYHAGQCSSCGSWES